VPAVNPQTTRTPQITILSGSQFVQRGKKFAMVLADTSAAERQPPS
jgi:hypothetical protein